MVNYAYFEYILSYLINQLHKYFEKKTTKTKTMKDINKMVMLRVYFFAKAIETIKMNGNSSIK